METLKFTYRGKEITAPMEIVQKYGNVMTFHVIGKNGQRFIFLKYGNEWSHIEGTLSASLREAILDALIMRFEFAAVKTFIYQGKRQIVTVNWVYGGGVWDVKINHISRGWIAFYENEGFRWRISEGETWLKPRHMEYFIELIKAGKIVSTDPLDKKIREAEK
ncbi:hypothetical protein [Sphingobacterium allocomposti]|nr:hypothetical protein [Sphingobacterium composti Yoo et al. 2007 non Ten et al. 2007]